MRFGYIGLGNIGAPMARRIAECKGQLAVFDAVALSTEVFRADAKICNSPAELGSNSDLVGICVRDDDDVIAVVAGQDGLLASMAAGGAIAVHSTVRPATIRALHEQARSHGIAVIDAAVTGGPEVAERGELTVMVGGSDDEVALIKPLLDNYCRSVVHAGGTGMGMTLKLCNNLVTYIELAAAVEGYRLAAAAGLEADQLTQVMNQNGNLTPAMRAYIGYRTNGPDMVGKDKFLSSQHALVELALKDLGLAQEAAAEFEAFIPVAQAIRKNFQDTVFKGIIQ